MRTLTCLLLPCLLSAQAPVMFRPGVPSIAVDREEKRIVFPQRQSPLMLSRPRGNGWSTPEPIPWSREHACGDPCFSFDGRQLYFWSRRPREGSAEGQADLWVSEATPEGWGTPRCLGIQVNGKRGGFVHPVPTARGDLYFTGRHGSLGRRDLFVARRNPGGYAEPENLGPRINSAEDEFDGFVSLDEKILLFCRSRRTPGSDLYVCRRQGAGWTEPRWLGPEVNFGAGPLCPSLSRDGRWLYFTSSGGDGRAPGIYRIDAVVLEESRPASGLAAERLAHFSRLGAFGLTFQPDGTACFAESHGFLMESRLTGGRWSEASVVPGTQEGINLAPAFSPDGRYLWFVSNRSSQALRSELDAGIWSQACTPDGWGEARRLGNLLDERRDIYVDSPSVAADGVLYFTALSEARSPNSRLFVADGRGPARLHEAGLTHAAADVAEVAVSPDGATLVFSSSQSGGIGGYDLYVSRRAQDGSWSTPRNLGAGINSPANESHPSISADGRNLYFFSDRAGNPGIYKVPMP